MTMGPGACSDAAKPPLVSIVLCTYNGSRFLAAQLDSLLAQTYRNIEIVAVDDASADDSVAVLNRYAERDARIRVVVNSANLGFARNFESSLERSRGEFIAPCDQDDIWLPDKITALMAAIDGHSMAYCDSTLVDAQGTPCGYRMSQVLPMRSIDDPLPFAFGNCVSGHAMLFRRSLLERALPVPAGFFYDWWLAAVAAATEGVAFCDRSLVLYRQHGANVTETRMAQMLVEAGLSGSNAQGSPDQEKAARDTRQQGSRLRYLRETEQRLGAIGRMSGRHQPFALELQRLWHARESQWLSLALWKMMTGNRERLLSLTGMSARKKARYCADFLWGLRTKRLTRKRAYAAPDVS